MMRALRGSLAALLGVSCALAVGCGDDKLLSGSDADSLKGSLADLRAAVDDRDCQEVETQLTALRDDLKNVDPTVDRKLRAHLREQITSKLRPQAEQECQGSTSSSTASTTEAPTTTQQTVPQTTTETVPPETTSTATTPSTTTTTPTTPSTTVPTTPATPDPGADDGTGGVAPGADLGGGAP